MNKKITRKKSRLIKSNFDDFLQFNFLPHAWQIDFFDDETKQEWYIQYKNIINILRKSYPELKHWTDLQLVTAYEEFHYQKYRTPNPTPARYIEFLDYLYLYQVTKKKPITEY